MSEEVPRFSGHRGLAHEREKAGLCYLCGKQLDASARSADHVPPKQIYPKAIREKHSPQLLTLPTHATCNKSHQADEDYLVATLVPLVRGTYAGNALWHEHQQRFHNRPTRQGLALKVLGEFEERPSGLSLPDGLVAKRMDGDRVARAMFKIARGLLWVHEGIVLPEALATTQKVYGPDEDPGPVMTVLADVPRMGQYPGVFDYAYKVAPLAPDEPWGCVFGMLFWDQLFARVGFELP
jgi:hypothetical protein